jgi:hypothetical protein
MYEFLSVYPANLRSIPSRDKTNLDQSFIPQLAELNLP